MTARVVVSRGATVESVHRVHVVVADAAGRIVAQAGDPQRVTFYRSAAKPLQMLPLVEDGVVARFGLTAEELAVCCASHGGEPAHVAAVSSVLAKLGLGAGALACGAQAPLHEASALALAARGEEPQPIHNNCSGKHAGMLALALAHGWPTSGYHQAGHPVQRRMRAEIARWSGVPGSELAA
ncbi:MAG: asparaginase [Gemmatimonadetes bacterium]|nr:asparaginase [Gemmatimonadota bacterium]